MKKVVLACLIAVFTIANANANNNYLRLGTGFSRGTINSKFDGALTPFNIEDKENAFPTFTLGIGREYKNLDLSANFKYADYDIDSNTDFTVSTVSFDANYLFKNSSIFTPYAGVGLNVNKFDVKIDDLKADKTSTSFAFRIGTRAELDKNIMLDFNIQQTTKGDCFNETVYINNASNVGNFKGKYKDLSFNIGLLFRF